MQFEQCHSAPSRLPANHHEACREKDLFELADELRNILDATERGAEVLCIQLRSEPDRPSDCRPPIATDLATRLMSAVDVAKAINQLIQSSLRKLGGPQQSTQKLANSQAFAPTR